MPLFNIEVVFFDEHPEKNLYSTSTFDVWFKLQYVQMTVQYVRKFTWVSYAMVDFS
jgi:hypothetical protein